MTTDTLRLSCHFHGCGYEVGPQRVGRGEELPPYVVERWHLQMARHVRQKHMRRREATDAG